MPAHKLLLHPGDRCFQVPVDAMSNQLRQLGLIGPPLPVNDGLFFPTGEHFLQLVTFLGCSPAIELNPPDDPQLLEIACEQGSFCHVYLRSSPQPQLRFDPGTPAPRCPDCQARLDNWPEVGNRARSNPADTRWHCSHCDRDGVVTDLHFRKTAAIASSWVEIRGIYPSEAVPGDALLNSLQALGGGDWQVVYLRE